MGTQINRRRFLTAATATAAAVGAPGALAGVAGAHGGKHHGRGSIPRERISIQLYTLRDQLAIDLQGTLEALSEIGYRRVEHAGFVGRTATEFKAALDAAGLRATSGHMSIPQPFDAAAWSAALQDALTVGSRYIVHPYFGVDSDGVIRDSATWEAFARDLNTAGRMARQVGLRFGYHNHNQEFFAARRRPVADGVRPARRGDRPAARALRAGPLLDLARRARPGGRPPAGSTAASASTTSRTSTWPAASRIRGRD